VKLFCFPHAGGSAAMFNEWNRALGPRVGVVAVDIANRERFATLHQLACQANDQLLSQLDEPHVFFGHSFGALLAYRVACLRAAAGLPPLSALVVSSCAAPHLPAPVPGVDHLDDDQLAALLTDLGGIPPEIAEWPTLRDRALAAARNDLRLYETDDEQTCALTCSIHAIGGSDDPLVTESDLEQWRSRTSGHFCVQLLHGGHFYLRNGPQFFSALRPLLSTLVHR
jgi:surfactin synthase thioesterase subunit